ncbi:hypothetical protein PVA44_07620 (plasmid) [Entomospira nematocerorum]|uniref:Uncharacterized protein n=1 Tax=Entomospira nematocerorum TaxID=2719987 RepID=A0A968GDF7_9SPIO|nr:hypothetical protein [Entomospira nematocera]NIZ47780.1 hypothetical protein [Entomospira nematocera]WDI34734.1 hypothetical protein PVA44_07620 [Entomospira nematocera]
MDVMLGDDANGFDLMLIDNDIRLVSSAEESLWNTIKVALFTQDSWSGNALLSVPIGSSLDRLVRLPVNEDNRKRIQRELARALHFILEEKLAKELIASVIIVDRKRYSLRLAVDGKSLSLDSLLEVR